ncbi:kyphoscoliosis peptidase-like [Clytia hemisphaerica]|uniref:Transglutaminase-like domain-containing protein n=1 Tax=Clytia hemisphaerica TaxID=252671 RepID=A0A7M5VCW3_9CNID|eukprot:TCONS_00050084-protein
MGCGSSKVAVSTVLVNGTQDGAILKDANGNITQSKPIGSNEKERLGSQLGSSNRLGPVESLGIFRKRKKNLYQSLDVFEQIDQRSVTVPSTVSRTAQSLVQYLTEPYEAPLFKLRAIWIWVTHNISYDVNSFFNPSEKKSSQLDASDVLSSGKAICSGYANLINVLAESAGIKTERVDGWSKGYNYQYGQKFGDMSPNHAWNVVKLNNDWWLLDSTWGAGYVDKEKNFVRQYSEHYFLTDPKQFIFDHCPTDMHWQLLEEMIAVERFENYARVTKHFFRLKMKLFSHQNGIVVCETGRLHLKFRIDKDIPIKCTGKLSEVDGDVDTDQYIHVYSTEKTLHVLVDVPRVGQFDLKIFARELNSEQSNLNLVCRYAITCTNKLGPSSSFPRQFKRWSPGFYLHSPTDGVLYNGETYKFRISLPNVTEMAVCLGGKNSTWERIPNSRGALWEGEITLPDWVERVNVVARFEEKTPFSSLLEYKVAEKDWAIENCENEHS